MENTGSLVHTKLHVHVFKEQETVHSSWYHTMHFVDTELIVWLLRLRGRTSSPCKRSKLRRKIYVLKNTAYAWTGPERTVACCWLLRKAQAKALHQRVASSLFRKKSEARLCDSAFDPGFSRWGGKIPPVRKTLEKRTQRQVLYQFIAEGKSSEGDGVLCTFPWRA